MLSKSPFTSKTLWFNGLALLIAVAGAFGYTGELPAEWAIFVPVIVTGVNMALRYFFTNSSLRSG